jgi:hypothetical protein
MMQQTLLEINSPFDVHCPLGYGVALFLVAGSFTSNPQFIVKLYNTGEVKSVDTNDIRIYGSPSYGEALKPEIPNGWKK